jgi:hypothetical protein
MRWILSVGRWCPSKRVVVIHCARPYTAQKAPGGCVTAISGSASKFAEGTCYECRPVVRHLTPYFVNWPVPVRIWCMCRPGGAVGTYSPRCRGQWSYNIPCWPLCRQWLLFGWGRFGQAELQARQPHPNRCLGCACSWARRTIHEVGIRWVSSEYDPLSNCAGLQYARQRAGLLCASWSDLSSKAVDLSGSTCLTMLRFSEEENDVVFISMRK